MAVSRIPIKVTGYIEVVYFTVKRITIDPYDYDYTEWPFVGGSGDEMVVQFDDASGRRLEFDADVVMRVRRIAEADIDSETVWEVDNGIQEAVKGTPAP